MVQINTQLNAALDKEDIKTTAQNIQTTKSKIATLKDTITSQKSDLQTTIDVNKYENIQKQIANNTKQLQQLQIEYRTSLKYLQDAVMESGAVTTKPKYHIRGFFPIPEPQYIDEERKAIVQQVIGFDVMYRYLKLDESGTDLKTYRYEIDGVEHSGVFTDWLKLDMPKLYKVFNEEEDVFEWKNESISDGTVININ